jgi:ribosomal protein S18 acetylase RimI-like enzyme
MNVENSLILQKIANTEPLLPLVIKDSIGSPTPSKINLVLQSYNQANHYLIGAFIKHQLVGVIGFETINQIATIKHISILPEFRKQKIGKLLIQYIIKQYFLQEIKCETDTDSVRFYKSLRFECISFQSKYGVRYNCCLQLLG